MRHTRILRESWVVECYVSSVRKPGDGGKIKDGLMRLEMKFCSRIWLGWPMDGESLSLEIWLSGLLKILQV